MIIDGVTYTVDVDLLSGMYGGAGGSVSKHIDGIKALPATGGNFAFDFPAEDVTIQYRRPDGAKDIGHVKVVSAGQAVRYGHLRNNRQKDWGARLCGCQKGTKLSGNRRFCAFFMRLLDRAAFWSHIAGLSQSWSRPAPLSELWPACGYGFWTAGPHSSHTPCWHRRQTICR